MRQLMTQRIANNSIRSVSIARIRAEAQLDDLAFVSVEAQGAGVVGGVLGRVHFREDADGEAVGAHGGFDAGVCAEAFEVVEGAGGVGEMGEGE